MVAAARHATVGLAAVWLAAGLLAATPRSAPAQGDGVPLDVARPAHPFPLPGWHRPRPDGVSRAVFHCRTGEGCPLDARIRLGKPGLISVPGLPFTAPTLAEIDQLHRAQLATRNADYGNEADIRLFPGEQRRVGRFEAYLFRYDVTRPGAPPESHVMAYVLAGRQGTFVHVKLAAGGRIAPLLEAAIGLAVAEGLILPR